MFSWVKRISNPAITERPIDSDSQRTFDRRLLQMLDRMSERVSAADVVIKPVAVAEPEEAPTPEPSAAVKAPARAEPAESIEPAASFSPTKANILQSPGRELTR